MCIIRALCLAVWIESDTIVTDRAEAMSQKTRHRDSKELKIEWNVERGSECDLGLKTFEDLRLGLISAAISLHEGYDWT